MKILLDIYLAKNLGDDMFLDHFAKELSNTEITPFYPGRDYSSFFNRYPNVIPLSYSYFDRIKTRLGFSKLKNYKKLAQDYDAVVFLGGGIFREESYWKEVYDFRWNLVKAFSDLGKKASFIGCNFGPYYTEKFLEKHKEIFRIASKVSFRDEKSFDLFKSLPHVTYYPDLLWSYQLPDVEPKDGVAGISVIDPRHKEGQEDTLESYIQSHRRVCQKWNEQGKVIRIFSFCEKEGDLEIAHRIAKDIRGRIEIINYEGEITSFLKLIGECKELIAARFHAIIIGLKFGIKVLPIIYGDKTENLLTDIKYPGQYIFLNNISEIEDGTFWKIDGELPEFLKESRNHLI